jgi:hypothetical protein
MKKVYFLLLFAFLLINSGALWAQCNNGRYHDKIFSEGVTTVQYGRAMQYDSTYVNLMVDVYQPSGDNFAHRPLLIFAFGGSFTSGVRQSPDLVYLCTEFAERGYVCASIDYRLGVPSCNECDTNEFLALMRGVQDMKAAVRYFYKDAQTANQFRIDTDQIFIGGVSAGAFIALNYAYLKTDTFSIIPPGFAIPSILSLGGLDGNSGNAGYSEKVKGCIDLCGAIADTVWIMPGDPILVGVHGTADSLVACYYDSLQAITNVKSSLFGGGDIKHRLQHVQLIDSFYLFQGAGHCPFILPYPPTYNPIPWMDTTENIMRDFLYPNIVCDTATISGIETPSFATHITVFPNPADDWVYISSDGQNEIALQVLNVEGQLVKQEIIPGNSTFAISRGELNAGLYLMHFTDKTTGELLKTSKLIFY